MSQVAVSTTAILLAADADTVAEGECFLRNAGPNTCYLGGSDVTSGNGYGMIINQQIGPISLEDAAKIYGRCATAESATIHVLLVGV